VVATGTLLATVAIMARGKEWLVYWAALTIIACARNELAPPSNAGPEAGAAGTRDSSYAGRGGRAGTPATRGGTSGRHEEPAGAPNGGGAMGGHSGAAGEDATDGGDAGSPDSETGGWLGTGGSPGAGGIPPGAGMAGSMAATAGIGGNGGTGGAIGCTGADAAAGAGGEAGEFDLMLESATDAMRVGVYGSLRFAVRNLDPCVPAWDIVLTDVLPSSMSFRQAYGDGWSCEASNEMVTCRHPGPVNPGTRLDGPIINVVPTTHEGSPFENVARLTAVGDRNSDNDERRDSIGVEPPIDLSIRVSYGGGAPCGSYASPKRCFYTAAVTNVGIAATVATIYVSCGSYPTYAALSSAEPGWTCSFGGALGSVNCRRSAPLEPGQSTMLGFSTYGSAGTSGELGCEVETAGDAFGDNDYSENGP
jgi:hypothetical protein